RDEGRAQGWLGSLSYAYNLGSMYFGGTTKYIHFNVPAVGDTAITNPDGDAHIFQQDLRILVRHRLLRLAPGGQHPHLTLTLRPPSRGSTWRARAARRRRSPTSPSCATPTTSSTSWPRAGGCSSTGCPSGWAASGTRPPRSGGARSAWGCSPRRAGCSWCIGA